MRLSKRSEYGLKAAVRLARSFGRGYVQSREIAETEHLPPKFLESILFNLRSASILDSKVGAGGGYRLSRPPEQIWVHELIEALERHERENGDGAPDALPIRRLNGSAGGMAMDVLNARIIGALSEAIGGLTLNELVNLAEARMPARQDAMYYI